MKPSTRAAIERRLRYNPLNRTDAERIASIEAGAERRAAAARTSDFGRREEQIVDGLLAALKARSGS